MVGGFRVVYTDFGAAIAYVRNLKLSTNTCANIAAFLKVAQINRTCLLSSRLLTRPPKCRTKMIHFIIKSCHHKRPPRIFFESAVLI